jgi:hypothetical protein
MPKAAQTVRSVRKWNGISGREAFRSQNTKTGKRRSPITSGATMPPSLHLVLTPPARVRGIKVMASAAVNIKTPNDIKFPEECLQGSQRLPAVVHATSPMSEDDHQDDQRQGAHRIMMANMPITLFPRAGREHGGRDVATDSHVLTDVNSAIMISMVRVEML